MFKTAMQLAVVFQGLCFSPCCFLEAHYAIFFHIGRQNNKGSSVLHFYIKIQLLFLHSGFTQELFLCWEGLFSLSMSVSGLCHSGLSKTLSEASLCPRISNHYLRSNHTCLIRVAFNKLCSFVSLYYYKLFKSS